MIKGKLSFAVAAVMLLCGCSSDSNRNNPSNDSSIPASSYVSNMGLAPSYETVLYEIPDISEVKSGEYDSGKIVFVVSDYSGEKAFENQNKINEILKNKGFKKQLEFKLLDDMNYKSELVDYINGGGQADILFTNAAYADKNAIGAYHEFVDRGWLCDITELVNSSEGEKLKNSYSETFWTGMEINGKIYGVGHNITTGYGISAVFNTELCGNYGFDLSTFDGSLETIRDWCFKIKESNISCDIFEPRISLSGVLRLSGMYGDPQLSQFGMGAREENGILTAVNIYEDQGFKNTVKTLSEIYSGGCFYDINANVSSGNFFVKLVSTSAEGNSLVFAYGNENMYEIETTEIELIKPQSITTINNVSGVCTLSRDKESAFEALAIMYSDPDISNLMEYGTTEYSEDLISPGMSLGNHILTFADSEFPKEKGDKKQAIQSFNSSVEITPLSGFCPDYEKGNFAALYNANAQGDYLYMGMCGSDWESIMTEMSNLMKEAGIDNAISTINEDLN
ncbi:hypothetical protein [Ruminococcus sp. Marseille-P6503]|uniref:hypothetical protein n=1 Tax=Ruminococcus sp. Marseille-P6503 TaxID=2364796 RepID=UPI000F53D22B|nr:hypothetical protein [Ruminococcus sp. Marseille-P6503]